MTFPFDILGFRRALDFDIFFFGDFGFPLAGLATLTPAAVPRRERSPGQVRPSRPCDPLAGRGD